jgi:hypothetical protein
VLLKAEWRHRLEVAANHDRCLHEQPGVRLGDDGTLGEPKCARDLECCGPIVDTVKDLRSGNVKALVVTVLDDVETAFPEIVRHLGGESRLPATVEDFHLDVVADQFRAIGGASWIDWRGTAFIETGRDEHQDNRSEDQDTEIKERSFTTTLASLHRLARVIPPVSTLGLKWLNATSD